MKWLAFAALILSAKGQNYEEEAALVIGGLWIYEDAGERILSSVEVFGCQGGNGVEVQEYPNFGVQLSAALLYEDSILACGGFGCNEDGDCGARTECHTFSLTDDSGWSSAPEMTQAKFNHFLALGRDAENANDPDLKPIALGFGASTQILDGDAWRDYLPLPYVGWQGTGCIVQYDDRLYAIRDEIVMLDLSTWSFQSLGLAPVNLDRPSRCTLTFIDDDPGIFLRFGYWFNLVTETWHKKAR